MNDAEARIREAENRLRALELFARQADQLAVGQYQTAVLLTQIGGYGRQTGATTVFTDPTCSVGLPSVMLMTDDDWGTCNLTWVTRGVDLVAPHDEVADTASLSNAWQGCKSITDPYTGTVSATRYTVFPPHPSFPASYSFYQEMKITSKTTVPFTQLVAATCSSTFTNESCTPVPTHGNPSCGPPWTVVISANKWPSGTKSLTLSVP